MCIIDKPEKFGSTLISLLSDFIPDMKCYLKFFFFFKDTYYLNIYTYLIKVVMDQIKYIMYCKEYLKYFRKYAY